MSGTIDKIIEMCLIHKYSKASTDYSRNISFNLNSEYREVCSLTNLQKLRLSVSFRGLNYFLRLLNKQVLDF